MCGLAFSADVGNIILLTFLTPCVAESWGLSVAQKATLGSAVFLGQLMGATIWGPLADTYGRRPAFLMSCAVVGIAGVLSSIMTSLTALLVCRTLCGIGIGGTLV